jgi:hypothetical protein
MLALTVETSLVTIAVETMRNRTFGTNQQR